MRDKSSAVKTRENVNSKLIYAIMTALLAGLVTALTAYFHVPAGHGYIHIGDSVIFLAAAILPMPYAMAVGAIGGGLADVLSGVPIWAPATIVIKAVMILTFTSKDKKIVNWRNVLSVLFAMVITCLGYCAYDGIAFGEWAVAIAGIPDSIVQVGASGLIFVLLGLAMDAAKLKTKLMKKF